MNYGSGYNAAYSFGYDNEFNECVIDTTLNDAPILRNYMALSGPYAGEMYYTFTTSQARCLQHDDGIINQGYYFCNPLGDADPSDIRNHSFMGLPVTTNYYEAAWFCN